MGVAALIATVKYGRGERKGERSVCANVGVGVEGERGRGVLVGVTVCVCGSVIVWVRKAVCG